MGYKERYATSLHEALHSISTGLDTNSYLAWRSYEEATVTSATELLMNKVSSLFGIGLLVPANACPRLTKLLEYFRADAGLTKQEFYIKLLQIPLADRRAGIIEMIGAHRGQSITVVMQDVPLMDALTRFESLRH